MRLTRTPLKLQCGRPLLLLVLTLGLTVSTRASDEASVLSSIGINSVAVCYNFSCSERSHVSLSQHEWAQVAGWFNPAASNAGEERQQIRHAVGWMEELVGRHTPTHRDVAGNLPENAQMPGQLDCIDESRNTTTYLKLLQTNNLLRFHRVVERAYRRALFDQHWSGQIEEISNGDRYVVDSWFQDNGMLPYVQSVNSWKQIPLFSSFQDNSDAQGSQHDLARSTSSISPEQTDAGCGPRQSDCAMRNTGKGSIRE